MDRLLPQSGSTKRVIHGTYRIALIALNLWTPLSIHKLIDSIRGTTIFNTLSKLKTKFAERLSLGTPLVPGSDETYFCAQFIKRRELDLQELALPIGVAYNLVSAIIVPMFTDNNTIVAILSIVHAFNALLCSAAIIENRCQALSRNLLPIALISSPAAYLIVSRINIERMAQGELVISISMSVLLTIFGIMLFPARPKLFSIMAVSLSGLAYYATQKHESHLPFTFILFITSLTTVIYRIVQHAQLYQIGRREYGALVQTAPSKIVRHSVESSQSLSEVLSTKLRHSVCLSSDWRSYQALSAKLDAGTLSRALGEYYNICGAIFSRHFPHGNYYSDWIADELFVVSFAQDDHMDYSLMNSMISAGIDLLEAKKKFHEKFGFPAAIDVGISSGSCLIGMMGPDWHKKATALGEVAGRSRRYQSVGKLIRNIQGEKDRIIFGSETIMDITRPFDVKPLDLPAGKTLRDLDGSQIFYIESGIQKKSNAA